MTAAQLSDLIVGLIKVCDAQERLADEGAEIVPCVAELTAIVHNQGDALADETTTRFWYAAPTSTANCGSSIPPPCRRARRSRSPRCETFAAAAASTCSP